MKTKLGFALSIALATLTSTFADDSTTFDGGVAAESWSCALQCEIAIDYDVQKSGLFGSYTGTKTVAFYKTAIAEGPSAGSALQNTINSCESWSNTIIKQKRATDSLSRVKSARTMPGYSEASLIYDGDLNKRWTITLSASVAHHQPSMSDCARN